MPMFSTLDLVEELPVDSFLGHLEATDLLHRPVSAEPLRKLMHPSTKQLNVLSARSAENGVTSVSTGDGLSVNLYSGRKVLSCEEFVNRAKAEQPSAIVSMADDIPFYATKKRRLKAKERTEKWFRALRSCRDIDWDSTMLFGSVVGEADSAAVCKSAKTCLESGAHGN
jgi:hypothetical protein